MVSGIRGLAPGEQFEKFQGEFPRGFRAWVETITVLGEEGGRVEWREMPWHEEFYAALLSGEDICELKVRKLGMTTMWSALLPYFGMWSAWWSAIYITYHEDAAFKGADSFKARMQGVYQGLDEWQRVLCPIWDIKENRADGGFGTEKEVVWKQGWHKGWRGGGVGAVGRQTIATAAPNVGAGSNYKLAVLDEEPRYEDSLMVWASVVPSVRPSGGRVFYGGSLDIVGAERSLTYAHYQAVRRGELAGTRALFHGFGSRPEQTPEFYRREKEFYGAMGQGGELILHRMYPLTAEEALAAQQGGLCGAEGLRCIVPAPSLVIGEDLLEFAYG